MRKSSLHKNIAEANARITENKMRIGACESTIHTKRIEIRRAQGQNEVEENVIKYLKNQLAGSTAYE